MEDTEIKRKLATILVADIVGYSRLTANDEDWTIRALAEFRKIVDEIIQRHDGRIFSTGGDSVLAEFASPVEAVRAAVDFQEAARSRNLLQPRDHQLRFRIGLNLGDVMVRGHDLLGDGVNVAARLEGLAEPGGICVSGTVWDHINGKLSIGYVDIGEQSVKNIPRPIRAYHLRVDGGSDEIAAGTAHPVAAAQPAPAAAPRQRGVVAALIGAGVIIVALAGVIVWQFWPKGGAPGRPAASAAVPAPAAPATPAVSPFQTALSARLAVLAPAMSEKARDDHAHSYVTGQTHKAIAVPPGGNGNWQARNRGSIENATDSALENCQLYYNQPCVLAAADDALQPMPTDGKPAPRDMPRLRYAGNFDPAQIPGVPQPVRERADVAGYAAAPSPKAAAFHSGGGWLFAVTGAADQHAAEVGALKACTDDVARQPPGGSSSCYLYAVENRVVLPQRLKAPMTAEAPAGATTPSAKPTATAPIASTAAAPPAVAAAPALPAATLTETLRARLSSAVPGLSEGSRDRALLEFTMASKHRAFAVLPEPVGYWNSWSHPTRETAVEATLEGCQVFHNRHCVLLAMDDEAIEAPPDGKWMPRDMPRVHYAGDFDPGQIPGVSVATRARTDVVGYRLAAAPKAVAYHPIRARVHVITNAATQRAAEEQVLKACNDDPVRAGLGGPCFLYAVENRVVLPRRLKEPLSPVPAAR